MAKRTTKATPFKHFPLLVLIDQDQHYAEKPYIIRTHIKIAIQSLQLTALHVKAGQANIDMLIEELDTMYKELSSPVQLSNEEAN